MHVTQTVKSLYMLMIFKNFETGTLRIISQIRDFVACCFVSKENICFETFEIAFLRVHGGASIVTKLAKATLFYTTWRSDWSLQMLHKTLLEAPLPFMQPIFLVLKMHWFCANFHSYDLLLISLIMGFKNM